MTCKYCGEPITDEEPDIRYRPGDGKHRLDFHSSCYSIFAFDATMWVTEQLSTEALSSDDGLPDDMEWDYWLENADEFPKERP